MWILICMKSSSRFARIATQRRETDGKRGMGGHPSHNIAPFLLLKPFSQGTRWNVHFRSRWLSKRKSILTSDSLGGENGATMWHGRCRSFILASINYQKACNLNQSQRLLCWLMRISLVILTAKRGGRVRTHTHRKLSSYRNDKDDKYLRVSVLPFFSFVSRFCEHQFS